jgi:hypothetical protein
MTWLSCIHTVLLILFYLHLNLMIGKKPKHVVQDNKTNKLMTAYVSDLRIESCVDMSLVAQSV